MKVALASMLAAGAVIAFPAIAAADPPAPEIPVDPAAPAPPPPGGIPPLADLTSPLAQSGTSSQPLSGGLPLQVFSGDHNNEYFLAQNPVPAAPGVASGGPAVATPPNLSPFNNAYLLPQNLVRAAPGEGQVYDV